MSTLRSMFRHLQACACIALFATAPAACVFDGSNDDDQTTTGTSDKDDFTTTLQAHSRDDQLVQLHCKVVYTFDWNGTQRAQEATIINLLLNAAKDVVPAYTADEVVQDKMEEVDSALLGHMRRQAATASWVTQKITLHELTCEAMPG